MKKRSSKPGTGGKRANEGATARPAPGRRTAVTRRYGGVVPRSDLASENTLEVAAGIPATRLDSSGAGEDNPLEPEAAGAAGAEARSHNRRVELERTTGAGASEPPMVGDETGHDDGPAGTRGETTPDRPRRSSAGPPKRRVRGPRGLAERFDGEAGFRLWNYQIGTATLHPNHQRALESFFYPLKKNDSSLRIIGHTSGTGDEKENPTLAEERARAVAEFAKAKGISGGRLIDVHGAGASQPLEPELVDGQPSAAAMARNRRTELHLVDPLDQVATGHTPMGADGVGHGIPSKGADTNWITGTSIASDVVAAVLEGVISEVLGLLGPFLSVAGLLSTISATKQNERRAARLYGIRGGASGACALIKLGRSRVTYDEVWSTMRTGIDQELKWYAYPLGPDQAEWEMSIGANDTVTKIFNPAMEMAEQHLKSALRANFSAEWRAIYDKNVARYRGRVADQLCSELIVEVDKLK